MMDVGTGLTTVDSNINMVCTDAGRPFFILSVVL
jgi:hypothetical protein